MWNAFELDLNLQILLDPQTGATYLHINSCKYGKTRGPPSLMTDIRINGWLLDIKMQPKMTGEVKWEHLVTRVKGTFLNGSLPKDVECNSNN